VNDFFNTVVVHHHEKLFMMPGPLFSSLGVNACSWVTDEIFCQQYGQLSKKSKYDGVKLS
jgi:hypothetical protein